jgi:CubicO group peptidase (beta-lactamase class C family)
VSAGVQALLDEGARAGVFPCARAVVRLRGRTAFAGGAGGATAGTVFDLASLTKIMATTAACLAGGGGRFETPVARWLPDSPPPGRVTVGDLLSPRGLPRSCRAGAPRWPRP